MCARKAVPAAALLAIVMACIVGCGPTDPRERVLEERSQWKVQLLDWAVRDDGTISVSARLSGPPSGDLKQLTVKLLLQDASGTTMGHEWRTLDLSGIRRGGPEDVTLRIPPRETPIEGIGIDPVLAPTPEDEPHIPELN